MNNQPETATAETAATTIEIGEAITAKVKTISGAESAVFDLVPDFSLPQVKARQIVIAPQAYARGNKGAASRDNPDEVVKVNIAVMQKCGSKTDIPALLLLTEAIATGLERTKVASGLVLSVEFDPLYDAEMFRQTKVFVAVCIATVKVLR